MPWTRAMDEKFEMLLAMIKEMKAGQEEMKAELEKKMEAGQERMEQIQEEMLDLIRADKEETRAQVESQVEGIKDHVAECIRRMEEEIQGVKGKVEEVEGEVHVKIEEVKSGVLEKMSYLDGRLSDLETRPNNFPVTPEFMFTRATVEFLTFERLTSWTIFKTQFDVVSSTNVWTDFVKASQLVATTPRILQIIPADKLTELTTIEKAL
ncbi:hypothetical protein AVEN_18352-1 [Araneus ventricosus]|uniref:Uncharacterized protein n=1 Tax=Araneus ventricosus TaxID=182803 RepID=A0A4Y2WJH6_ARAVE|nr:hypothetical protein AVEN_18352-1 [Araneus ventricosus]